jgi:acyl-CoA-binding protein
MDFDSALAALEQAQRRPGFAGTLTMEARLSLWALHKQGTVGDCEEPPPPAFQVLDRDKHDAWTRLRGMPKDAARRQYVAAVAAAIGESGGGDGGTTAGVSGMPPSALFSPPATPSSGPAAASASGPGRRGSAGGGVVPRGSIAPEAPRTPALLRAGSEGSLPHGGGTGGAGASPAATFTMAVRSPLPPSALGPTLYMPKMRVGYLLKQREFFKSWRDRWAVLDGKHLHYCEHRNDKTARAVIALTRDTLITALDVASVPKPDPAIAARFAKERAAARVAAAARGTALEDLVAVALFRPTDTGMAGSGAYGSMYAGAGGGGGGGMGGVRSPTAPASATPGGGARLAAGDGDDADDDGSSGSGSGSESGAEDDLDNVVVVSGTIGRGCFPFAIKQPSSGKVYVFAASVSDAERQYWIGALTTACRDGNITGGAVQAVLQRAAAQDAAAATASAAPSPAARKDAVDAGAVDGARRDAGRDAPAAGPVHAASSERSVVGESPAAVRPAIRSSAPAVPASAAAVSAGAGGAGAIDSDRSATSGDRGAPASAAAAPAAPAGEAVGARDFTAASSRDAGGQTGGAVEAEEEGLVPVRAFMPATVPDEEPIRSTLLQTVRGLGGGGG